MSTTPEALHLADLLEAGDTYDCGPSVVYGWPVRASYDPTDDAAAELRRQHAEIERLTAERDALKLTVERLHQHNTTTWNAGHTLGVMAGQKALTQAQDALKRDAWGNTQLTEALLAAEAERDALRAALAAAPAPHPDTADAERYRWLREHGDRECTEKDGYGGQTLRMGDDLDAAIDAARAQAQKG